MNNDGKIHEKASPSYSHVHILPLLACRQKSSRKASGRRIATDKSSRAFQ